jgi:thioredoxin 2
MPDLPIVKCPNCGKGNRVPSDAKGVPHCGNCGRTLPWIANGTEGDFAQVAENSSLPVLVDFWAPWCGPCRMVSPALETIAVEQAGRMKLVKVNTDDAPALSQRFGIRGIPTLVVLDHGKEIGRSVGAQPPPMLSNWVQSQLARATSAKP